MNIALCSHDFLEISNGKSESFGVYCYRLLGETIFVNGEHVVLKFHSNSKVEERGFVIFLAAITPGKFSQQVAW